MSPSDAAPGGLEKRRDFLKLSGRSAALTLAGVLGQTASQTGFAAKPAEAGHESFWGEHQPGISTPIQRHTYFIAFDLTTDKLGEVVTLLKTWSAAAAEMMARPAGFDPHADPQAPAIDSGAAVGIALSRLTINFGIGPGFFEKDGRDRYGLAAQRPAALIDLPRFPGDQLLPDRTGGDLSVQACADDPQVVEYVVRRLAKLANGTAVMRWAQMGFTGGFPAGQTPRNQMGFKDGTINVQSGDPDALREFVWLGDEAPAWARGGSYMVVRPIRIALDHWDDMNRAFQERSVGRSKVSGAPLGKRRETDALDLSRTDADGNAVVPEESHAALAAPETNGGAQILRRAFNYDNGITKIAERWPPWRQLMTFDAGLLFQCYQKDPRSGFVKLFSRMAVVDMLNQFTTHTGSGLFLCLPGARPGGFVGDRLLS